MTTTHTPGPWEVKQVEHDCEPYLRIRGTQLGCRFKICNVHREPGDAVEALANARLIAAAPELLAALIDLLPHAERNIADLNSQMVGTLYPAINEAKIRRAEAAIAKAKGTTT